MDGASAALNSPELMAKRLSISIEDATRLVSWLSKLKSTPIEVESGTYYDEFWEKRRRADEQEKQERERVILAERQRERDEQYERELSEQKQNEESNRARAVGQLKRVLKATKKGKK